MKWISNRIVLSSETTGTRCRTAMGDCNDVARQEAEINLLQAMYPDELSYDDKSSELRYQDDDGSLVLRIDESYPSKTKPTVIVAQFRQGTVDKREEIREAIASLTLGEEALDILITAFKDIAGSSEALQNYTDPNIRPQETEQSSKATFIIWLHHLLATEKRKLATRPTSPLVHGITKPGYPGVMIFSGQAAEVREHVGELRSLNWQAFQVRYEADEEWTFMHGNSIKEVETMSEVTQDMNEDCKKTFLGAMRMTA